MYLLLGYGKANKSVEKYLIKNKIKYTIYDDCMNSNIDLDNIELIIKSPGIMNNHYIIKYAKTKGIKIISDLEYFYLCKEKYKTIVVTGTNGKSTTSSLLKSVLTENVLGGNIGIPIFDFIDSDKELIIEASSYMLEYTYEYRAKFNCILNLRTNHLEHHLIYKDYIKSKIRLFKNLLRTDYIIFNYDDLLVKRIVQNYDCYKIPFSKKERVMGCCIKNNYICFNSKRIMDLNEIMLIGDHNIENILATVAITYCYGVDIDSIRSGIKKYINLEHRLEKIFTYKGIKNNITVYNDSKATNYMALNSAINAFNNKRVLLISGGEYKEDTYELINEKENIKRILLFGNNRENISKKLNNSTFIIKMYSTLNNLLDKFNFSNLEDVDIILFSPGSPSYDEFNSFEERGWLFKKKMKDKLNKLITND